MASRPASMGGHCAFGGHDGAKERYVDTTSARCARRQPTGRDHSVTDTSLIHPSEPSGPINLRILILIRWVAIAGQASTILIVHYGLGFGLPLVPALAVVASSA